ncbi:MAG: NADH-quinone oxidoreductase subunit A [Planctomycetota bacterium]
MEGWSFLLPILLFALAAGLLAVGLLTVGTLLGPKRSGQVKEMPYESGMDPIHDARRRFDVRFHLVAVAFLLFDVELLFLYPWAVASRNPAGLAAVRGVSGDPLNRWLVFAELMLFLTLLLLGWLYAWRKGVFRWR